MHPLQFVCHTLQGQCGAFRVPHTVNRPRVAPNCITVHHQCVFVQVLAQAACQVQVQRLGETQWGQATAAHPAACTCVQSGEEVLYQHLVGMQSWCRPCSAPACVSWLVYVSVQGTTAWLAGK